METSLAEDVKKPTRTLSPDSFFFMSPYRSFTTSGCFRRFSQPAVGGDALNGEFQQQMAAAFAEARAAGIRKPVMVGAIPFDTCQPSELYIPERWEAFSRPEKQRSARYAAPLLLQHGDVHHLVHPEVLDDLRRWRRWRWWSVGRSRSRTRF